MPQYLVCVVYGYTWCVWCMGIPGVCGMVYGYTWCVWCMGIPGVCGMVYGPIWEKCDLGGVGMCVLITHVKLPGRAGLTLQVEVENECFLLEPALGQLHMHRVCLMLDPGGCC